MLQFRNDFIDTEFFIFIYESNYYLYTIAIESSKYMQ